VLDLAIKEINPRFLIVLTSYQGWCDWCKTNDNVQAMPRADSLQSYQGP